MIPDCLKLEKRQIDKINRFLSFLRENNKLPDDHEDASMASNFTFQVFATGLGDVIECRGFGHTINLTIDDDNELSPDEWGEF